MQDNIPQANLPPEDARPLTPNGLPELHYPQQLNAAVELVDENVTDGREEHVAIYFEDQEITYGALQKRVDSLGNALREVGVDPGDRVFVRFPNRPEFVISCLAAKKIGAVPVPSMKLLRADEISYVLGDAEPVAAIVDERLLDEVLEATEDHDAVPRDIVVRERTGGTHDHHTYSDLIDEHAASLAAAETTRDDAAMLAYTSGTTGRPKGTLHTHRQMLAIADGYANYCLDPEADDVFCSNAPIAFTFGYGMEVVFPFRFGASTCLLEDSDPIDLAVAVDEYGVTVLGSIPTAYNQLISNREEVTSEHDLSSLRLGVSAGEPLPPSTYEDVRDVFGIELLDGIGTTEMLHIFISHRHDDEIDPSATGYPVPGYECRVIDPQTGEELDRGQSGLLAVRGPTGVTYWNRPEKQDDAVRDGWSIPGDIFVHREDGRFEYKSRRDDLIITSGYNVPGPEVETVLEDHESVYESAVVGSPDEERGTIVKAFVVLREDWEGSEGLTETLQTHVKDRIAPYKYPREIEYMPDLPKTETGKIRRTELRERET